MKRLAIFLALIGTGSVIRTVTAQDVARDPVGLWLGVLNIGPIQMRVAFKFEADKAGQLSGVVNLIDQDDTPVPLETAKFTDGALAVDAPGVRFSGKFDAKGGIDGVFTQGTLALPLRLERIEKMPPPRPRPQTPKAPFPYSTEEVTFENPRGKFTLAGTLTVPEGKGPFPAVVFISGSGPQDRDETVFGHKPFFVLADHFARHGIASLRFDDRGVGKSKGTFAGSTTKNFAEDAEAALLFLKNQKRINPKRVGICGHSEGGTAAPLVALERPDEVAFLILLAATGVPGEKIFSDQIRYSGLAGDMLGESEIPQFTADVLNIIKSDPDPTALKKQARAALAKLAAAKKQGASEKVDQTVETMSRRLSDPWLRWFAAYDPATSLRKITCPILAINGSKDVQSRSKPNLDAIRSATAHNKNVSILEFDGLNHLFQKCQTGEFTEYGQIEETISPAVLRCLTEWIKARR